MQACQATARSALEKVNGAVEQFSKGGSTFRGYWPTGDAAEAAQTHISKKVDSANSFVEAAGTLVREIGAGADDLAHARTKLLQLVQAADSAGFHVDEQTGQVAPKHVNIVSAHGISPAANAQALATNAARLEAAQQEAAKWQAKIKQALTEFASVDHSIAADLGEAPNVTSAQAQAIIAQVDRGDPNKITNPLAALDLPSSVFSKKGKAALATWVHEHTGTVEGWIADQHRLNLPPAVKGYNFVVHAIDGSNLKLKLTYTLAIPAGVGVAALAFSKTGVSAGLSGTVDDTKDGETATASANSSDGFDAEVMTKEPGDNQVGFQIEPDGGLWMKAENKKPVGPVDEHGHVITDLKFRPAPKPRNPDPPGGPVLAPEGERVVKRVLATYGHVAAKTYQVGNALTWMEMQNFSSGVRSIVQGITHIGSGDSGAASGAAGAAWGILKGLVGDL